MTLHLKEGTIKVVQFRHEHKDDMDRLKPLLISYAKQGLMTFTQLYLKLGLNYAEVQELKKTFYISE